MKITSIDPNLEPSDKVIFYERTRRVMIAKPTTCILKDIAIMTFGLNESIEHENMVMSNIQMIQICSRFYF